MSKRPSIDLDDCEYEQYFENYFVVDYSTWYPYAKGYFKTFNDDGQENLIDDEETMVIDAVLYLHKTTSRPILIIKHKDSANRPVFWINSKPTVFDNHPKLENFRVEILHTEELAKEREFNDEVFYNMLDVAEKYNNVESVIQPDDLAQFLGVFIKGYQEYINFLPIHQCDKEEEEEEYNDSDNGVSRHCKRRK